MQRTKAMWTLLLGWAFLLSGEAPRVEGLTPCNLLSDPGLEFYPCQYKDCVPHGPSKWVPFSDVRMSSTVIDSRDPYMGSRHARLNGNETTGNDKTSFETLTQLVTIPSQASQAMLSFRLKIRTAETSFKEYDTLMVKLRSNYGVELTTLRTYSNRDASAFSSYQPVSIPFDATRFRGQTVQVRFEGSEDVSLPTSFLIDNVGLCIPVPFP